MRRRHRRGRRYGRRSRSFNGSSLVAAAKSNLNAGRVMQAGAFLAGGGANEFATSLAARYIPINALRSGIGNLGLGLVMSGIVGLVARKAAPKYAAAASLGALADVLTKGLFQFAPGIAARLTGQAPMVVAAPSTTKGYMGDYLTPGDVARARSLGDMGDYLTPGDVARARSLGYSDEMQDHHVADELASM